MEMIFFIESPTLQKILDKESGVSFALIGAHLSPQFVAKEIEGLQRLQETFSVNGRQARS